MQKRLRTYYATIKRIKEAKAKEESHAGKEKGNRSGGKNR